MDNKFIDIQILKKNYKWYNSNILTSNYLKAINSLTGKAAS